MLLPLLAHAQDGTTAAPPPASGPAPTAAAPPPGTPPPGGAVHHDDDDHEHVRFRFGVGINGGYGFGGGLAGGAFGASVRAGVQINRMWGAYYQSSALIFAAADSAGQGALAVVAPQSIVASVNPVDFLEIALGPSFDPAAGGSVSVTPGTTGASAFAGTFFGIQSRVALQLGGRNEITGRRRGFGLGLEFHPTFASTPVYFLTLGLSYEAW
jgi:hypothetical protein